jgi:hypothetical protein
MPWVSNFGVDVAGVVAVEGWVLDLTALRVRVEFGIVVEDTKVVHNVYLLSETHAERKPLWPGKVISLLSRALCL